MLIAFHQKVLSDRPFDALSAKHNHRWAAILQARAESQERQNSLKTLLGQIAGEVRPDMNFVVFGSLARGEWTAKSDIDWSLLVDGQADPADSQTARRIEGILVREKWKEPGPSGIFGSLSFSHALVHDIGGGADSHINITRRILLLLESVAVGDCHVRERVVRAVLARYLEEDTHFHPSHGSRSFVPRFLLNDVVRYWRTIAVDYASKTREHHEKKWALRNVKLRMSRKLLFVKGLLMCFLCHLEQGEIARETDIFGDFDPSSTRFIDFLTEIVDQTPLDLLAFASTKIQLSAETTEKLFGSYDDFLSALGDPAVRAHLENLTYEDARKDEDFDRMRQMSRKFQEGLTRLFFEGNSEITRLAQEYAIF